MSFGSFGLSEGFSIDAEKKTSESGSTIPEFPTDGILPKQEVQSLQFLKVSSHTPIGRCTLTHSLIRITMAEERL